MLRVGLVGFGFAGKTFHAPLLAATPGVEMAAIVQRSGDDAARAYPSAKLLRTYDELLAMDDVPLIVIATSNSSHEPLARAALEAGRNVVIDKPMTSTVSEARGLVALAEARSRVLSVFHNRRWDGDFLTLRAMLAAETLGRVTRFTSAFDRYRPNVDTNAWRQRAEPGSGVWFDLGPHLLDQALVAFGEPASVTASIRCERDGAVVDDAFDVTLHYANGLQATISASMLACAPRPRFTIDGTRGSWVKFGLDPQEAALKRGEVPGGAGWGEEQAIAHGVLAAPDASGAIVSSRVPTLPGDYLAYYANVRDAIAGSAQLAVTPQQALRVMELLEAAIQANAEQRAVPLYYRLS